MSDQDKKSVEHLKAQVAELKSQLVSKDREIQIYKQELLKFSHQLDGVMAQISQDTDILRKIQKVVSPTEFPEFPGFEMSRKFVYGSKFGGDYFDVFEHENRMKFGILLSSSSGYAMSALFLSMILKYSRTIEAKNGAEPHAVLELIGNELKTSANPKDQTQVFYGVIDRRELTMEFCALGRICGFVQTGDHLYHISSSSEGIGVNAPVGYKSLKIDLEPKSRVVLVTEGVLDVLDTDDLSKVVLKTNSHSQVHDVRNEIILQAQLKSGLETPLRDQTVVVIEVKDRVIKLAK
ncbi:MAG: PP2C family protein-serine/threonine phosphatase [Pseudobdellovibrio sp.]